MFFKNALEMLPVFKKGIQSMALHTILNMGLRQYMHTFKGTNYVKSSQCIYGSILWKAVWKS